MLSEGCLHCGSKIPTGSQRTGFCCAGCETVYSLLKDQGLTRYYSLARGDVAPVAEAPRARGFAWLEPQLERALAQDGGLATLELDVQGIHCAACVWLMNELFQRQGGGSSITVNPALGKVQLRWRKDRFDLNRYLSSVESFGYLFGPSKKKASKGSLDLPIRLGVSAAITMNVMIFSVSFYLGLTPAEGELFGLFTKLSIALSTAVVAIGGWPFFRAAWQGIRRRVLHLDLPIALGIALVYATSLIQALGGRGDLAYFDTLNTFVTLMLVGRWVQQRAVEKNRRYLLEDDGAEGLFVRRVEDGRVETVPASRIRAGDELLVAPGDLVPVDALLLDAAGRVSTAWITGEADIREVTQNAQLVAGACNEGQTALRARAITGFEDSALVALLRRAPDEGTRGFSRYWSVLSRAWVVGVLVLAGVGVLSWWSAGPDKAIEVAAALLVVTCPCAIGIAAPLAYELVQSRLRRQGVFVRSLDLLDRVPRVKKVLFDKTGTLTLGRLELADRTVVASLAPDARDAAFDMASRSSHPVSRCVADALGRAGARFDGAAHVSEIAGRGLELVRGGSSWRLGREDWAVCGNAVEGAPRTVLARDGVEVAAFVTRESVRPDARGEVAALTGAGYQVWLVSGDNQTRVGELATSLRIPDGRALWGCRPEDKAKIVASADDRDTLFLGDGVNDSLAFDAAFCAGTPAVDRPLMPGKSDFFLVGEGLAGVRALLDDGKLLRRALIRNLAVALVYNLFAVATSLAGLMTPLRAAVAMPASSLLVIGLVVWSLSSTRRPRGEVASAGRRPNAAPPVNEEVAA